MSTGYEIRDKARELYRQGWHEFEIENKLNIKCTEKVIPNWLKLGREYKNQLEGLTELQKRKFLRKIIHNANEQERIEKNRERSRNYQRKKHAEIKRMRERKLKPRAKKKIIKITKKAAKGNAINKVKQHKKCPVNNWLLCAQSIRGFAD